MTLHEDTALFTQLRAMWRDIDPMPTTLVDSMIAAVATEGLADAYALLTLVAQPLGAVRGDTDAMTLQFSDGTTSILLHVMSTRAGMHRIDGWVDASATEVVLTQGALSRSTVPIENGRFQFDDVPSGLTRVRLTTTVAGETRTMSTPQFEL